MAKAEFTSAFESLDEAVEWTGLALGHIERAGVSTSDFVGISIRQPEAGALWQASVTVIDD